MHLTLIRHGVTTWNVEGRWQGHSDTPLSPQGEGQASALAVRLADERFDLAFSSDLARARRTAELALPGQDITPDARLREVHFGAFDARTEAENRADPTWEAWLSGSPHSRFPGGESFEDVAARARAWAEALPDGARVIAFTHSVFIRALVCTALQIELAPRQGQVFPFPIQLGHASVTRLHRAGGHWTLTTYNDVAHLESWTAPALTVDR